MNLLVIIIIFIIGATLTAIITYFGTCKIQKENEEENKQKIEELKDKISILQYQQTETISEEIENTINSQLKEIERLKAKVKSLNVQKSELDDADAAITVLQAQLDEKERALQQAKSSMPVNDAELQIQLEKCKKELNDKEEEIDELEDDVKHNKKKVEEAKKKNEELQIQLDKSEKVYKQTASELDAKTSELDETNTILAQKKRALGFVNEILKAKDADDENAVETREKTEKILDIYCDEILDIYKDFKNQKEEDRRILENMMWQWSNLQRKTWLARKKVVSFVGEFSAGKTSIVNRILEHGSKDAPKLPVSSKATTAIPTYISYGTDFLSQFTNPDGDLKNISKESFESVTKEVLEQVNVSPLIQYFVMSYNNENLKNLSILDTPGFNSNDKNDAERTANVIKESDILFWVLDANAGEINKSSLQIIKEYLKDHPLFIVINKADTKSPDELNKLEEHIEITIKQAGISVNGYLRFSQKENINVLMKAINSIEDKDRNENLGILYNKFIEYKNEIDVKAKESKKELNKIRLQLENLIDKLKDLYIEIKNNCDDAWRVPHWEKHLLSKNVYEMNKDEFSRLNYYLQTAKDKSGELKKLGEKINECAKAFQNGQDSYQDTKSSLTRIENADKEFRKAVMALNPNFFQNNKYKEKVVNEPKESEKTTLQTEDYDSQIISYNSLKGKEKDFVVILREEIKNGTRMTLQIAENLGKTLKIEMSRADFLYKKFILNN